MIKVYCYSRCGTCKKALKWLDENNIEHEDIDIKTNHPDKDALKKYYAQSGLPLKRFFNTSGIPYRELGLSKKLPDMSEEDEEEDDCLQPAGACLLPAVCLDPRLQNMPLDHDTHIQNHAQYHLEHCQVSQKLSQGPSFHNSTVTATGHPRAGAEHGT